MRSLRDDSAELCTILIGHREQTLKILTPQEHLQVTLCKYNHYSCNSTVGTHCVARHAQGIVEFHF